MRRTRLKNPKKRSPWKTMRNKLDSIYSKIVRKTGQCRRCLKTEGLQCSHIHPRDKFSVRWDLRNAFCLCAGCHKYWWHAEPIEAAEFARQKLGIEVYEQLYVDAQRIKKWKVDEMKILLIELTKEFNK